MVLCPTHLNLYLIPQNTLWINQERYESYQPRGGVDSRIQGYKKFIGPGLLKARGTNKIAM